MQATIQFTGYIWSTFKENRNHIYLAAAEDKPDNML